MKASGLKRAVHGIFLLDKPVGISSNAALQRVRRVFQAEKAGHTGSLDPLASGLLPICFGRSSKLCGYLLDSDKRYVAQIRFGEKTSTGDAEGAVIARSDPTRLSRETLERALPQFLGVIRQIPPMYSALKHQGQRLYQLARQGIEVERQARDITIHQLRLGDFTGGECELDIRCSKGTYVRTLAEDIAAAVGQCAHLRALKRIETGPFQASSMYSMAQLEQAAFEGQAALDRLLLDSAAAFAGWPSVAVGEVQAQRLRQGLSQQIAAAPRSVTLAVTDDGGRLLCIAEADEAGTVSPKRWLAP